MSERWVSIAAGVLGLLVCGCGLFREPQVIRTYEGPARPRAEVAFLYESNLGFGLGFTPAHVTIQKIDGVQLDTFLKNSGIELLPGTHTIETSFFDATSKSTSNASVTFEAKAGHQYEIDGTALPSENSFSLRGKWTCWIVDIGSGAVVGGAPPSE